MEAAKTSKNLKEVPYPPQKKFLKWKGNSITLESRIIGGVGRIGGLDIVIIINNRGAGAGVGWNKDVLGGKKIEKLTIGSGVGRLFGTESTQAKTNAPISQTS